MPTSSLDVLRQQLAAVGFDQVSDQTLQRVSKELGEPFVRLVDKTSAAMAAEAPDAQARKERVKRALTCASPTVGDTLTRIGVVASLETVVMVARANAEFMTWVTRFQRGDDLAGQRIKDAFLNFKAQDSRGALPTQPQQPSESAHTPTQAASEHATRHSPATAPAPQQTTAEVRSPATKHVGDRTGSAGRPSAGGRPAGTSDGVDIGDAKQREGMHVYGGSAALFFEPTHHRRSGKSVLIVDGAKASGTRVYDWANKIIIQLTANEMLLLYAVLTGQLDQMKIDAHGEANDKRMEVKDQGDKFFISLMQRGKPAVGVPVTPLDAAQLALLISRQVIRENPQLRDMKSLNGFVASFVSRLQRRAA
jgi:hypothetical protein